MTLSIVDRSGNGMGVVSDQKKRPYQRHIVKRYLEDVGMNGSSSADAVQNTRAWNAFISQGDAGHIEGKSYGTYNIARSLTMGSSTSIVGCGGPAAPEFYMSPAYFNNTSGTAGVRDGYNAAAINCSNKDNVYLEGFRIRGSAQSGLIQRGVVARTCRNFRAVGIEVAYLSVGIGFAVAELTNNSAIIDPYIHDFYDNTSWNVQSTGIDVDNDRPTGANCIDLLIQNAFITRIQLGPVAQLASGGDQTDGINVVSYTNSGTRIKGGSISYVGEGIDHFGSHGVISGVTIHDTSIFGLKLIHGASYNVVDSIHIRNAGLAGLGLFASDDAGNTEGNCISNVLVHNIDASGAWKALAADTACFRVDSFSGATVNRLVNNSMSNCTGFEGANGKYGILGQLGASDTGNFMSSFLPIPGASNTRRIYAPAGAASLGTTLRGVTTVYTDLV